MNPTQTVAEIFAESGANPAEVHALAPHVSVHTLRHMLRGTATGITHAVPVAKALEELAERHRETAWQYEGAAERLRHPDAPPPTVGEVVRSLGLMPYQVVQANPEHLNLNTLHSILRTGKGRIRGDAHAHNVADALGVLAGELRQKAGRCETAAAKLRSLYPDRRVPLPPNKKQFKDGDRDEYMARLALSGERVPAIAEAFGVSRQTVHNRITAWEKRTGQKVPRYREVSR